MRRKVVFDVSHLVTRLSHTATSGVDRVDLAYARYLTQGQFRACAGTQYGLFRPHVLSAERMRSLVKLFERSQLETDRSDGPEWLALRARLLGQSVAPTLTRQFQPIVRARRFLSQSGYRIIHDLGATVPRDAIYLNVAQHA